MPSNYSKGRNLEYSVKRRLESLGYTVFRCAGSRPVDLIAIKEGEILLVECKTGLNPYLSTKQSNHILEISKRVNGTLVLAVRRRHREVKWFRATETGVEVYNSFIRCK